MRFNGWQPKNRDDWKNPPNLGSGIQTPKYRRAIPPPPPTPKKEDLTMKYTYKDCSQVVKIYDITYNTNGYPLFLIYLDGQWIRKSAKYFKPIEE